MAKPNAEQSMLLNELRDFVLEVMREMPEWVGANVELLSTIQLGVLRKNATQRHGVTRWRRGVDVNDLKPGDVDVIDLHPELLVSEWKAYSAFVLHHEYIHAFGLRAHDSSFRRLEASWPGSKAGQQGIKFTEALRRKRASWLWCCSKCGREYPRQKPSNGGYRCRTCDMKLIDREITTLT